MACGAADKCWRGVSVVNGPVPLVRTAISNQFVEPLKTLEPKFSAVENKPLLLTVIAVLVIGLATGLPPMLLLNSVKVMSYAVRPTSFVCLYRRP